MIDLNYEKPNKMINYITNNHSKLKHILMWEPKMCRLAWQRPRPPWHASQRPRHGLQRPRHACNVLGLLGMLPARS